MASIDREGTEQTPLLSVAKGTDTPSILLTSCVCPATTLFVEPMAVNLSLTLIPGVL